MNHDFIYYYDRTPYGTIYGKADLSAPKTVTDDDGTFNVYPTCAVTLQDDRVYYEEGDDIDSTFYDGTLERLNDAHDTSISRIDEQMFEEAKAMALEWIKKHDELMAQYDVIKKKLI